jgi:acyl carrier protein
MKNTELEARVRQVIAEAVKVDVSSIGARTPFAELGLDSVGAVALVAQLEETFDLLIPEGDTLHLTSVEAVVRYVARNAIRGGARR